MRTRTDVSAGGVVVDEQQRVLLCGRRDAKGRLRWVLPKGIVEEGEDPPTTAVREVREETGIEALIVKPLDKIEYWYVDKFSVEPARVHKFVHFYLMQPVGGDVEERDTEMEQVGWFPSQDALKQVAYPTEKRVLSQAVLG